MLLGKLRLDLVHALARYQSKDALGLLHLGRVDESRADFEHEVFFSFEQRHASLPFVAKDIAIAGGVPGIAPADPVSGIRLSAVRLFIGPKPQLDFISCEAASNLIPRRNSVLSSGTLGVRVVDRGEVDDVVDVVDR